MFSRVRDIILQREYQKKTNETRQESEKFSGDFSKQKEEFNRLDKINKNLRLENSNLINYNIKLNENNQKVLLEIEEHNQKIQGFAQEKEKWIVEISVVAEQLRNLIAERDNLLKEVKENTEINDKLKKKTILYNQFFLDLDDRISIIDKKIDKKSVELDAVVKEISESETILGEKIKENFVEKQNIEKTKDLLNLYIDRLNKHYDTLGLGIKLKKFGE